MTDLNPAVVQEKIAETQAEMIRMVEGMELIDCTLDSAIDGILERRSDTEWRAIVLFIGNDEQWELERNRLLDLYSAHSLDDIKRDLNNATTKVTISRISAEHRLTDQLHDLRGVMGDANYTVYLAQQPQPKQSKVYTYTTKGVTFELAYADSATEPEAFRLALMAAPQGQNIPLDYVYRKVATVPTASQWKHLDPKLHYIEIGDGGPVYEVSVVDQDNWVVWDLLFMYLSASHPESPKAFDDSFTVVNLHSGVMIERKLFGAALTDQVREIFGSERFRNLVESYLELSQGAQLMAEPMEFETKRGLVWQLQPNPETQGFRIRLVSVGGVAADISFTYGRVMNPSKAIQFTAERANLGLICVKDSAVGYIVDYETKDVNQILSGELHTQAADLLSLLLLQTGELVPPPEAFREQRLLCSGFGWQSELPVGFIDNETLMLQSMGIRALFPKIGKGE